MKKTIILLLLILFAAFVFAQDQEISILKPQSGNEVKEQNNPEDSALLSQFIASEEEQLEERPSETKNEEKPLKIAKPKQFPQDFVIEIFYIALINLYVVNWHFGKQKNVKIVEGWAAKVLRIYQANFTKFLGGKNKNAHIIKQSDHSFYVKCTGRNNCVGMQSSLTLQKRHDLFSYAVSALGIFPEQDRIQIDIIFPETAPSMVFAILRKKDEKKYKESHTDLEFCKSSTITGLSGTYTVCSEADEINGAFPMKYRELVSKYEPYFLGIHYTDQAALLPKYQKTMRIELILKSNTEAGLQAIYELTEMAIDLIDRFGGMEPTKLTKKILESHREKQRKQKEKELREEQAEVQEEKKLKLLREERQRRESMSPQKLAKLEEKEKKREQKKKMKKMAKLQVLKG